ncbi:L-lactate dehydrogenase [Rhodococcus sp. HNM0569]|uniref:L-lactate dehydrogenase n=1 Tax=Rhodococcus sp. HNM0569 TaxID=2716340 RepID=UPI00146A3261|nr:L-lactate dehydrogenase [Rhodococcus sp. HNM0569]NLU81381.1 L-lactate dehydrogenase [Rhodococcus sp. HNM0569]
MTSATSEVAKVSIVGAGSVGVAIAYAALIRGTAGTLAMYDLDGARTRAEVLDLNHGSQFVPRCHVIGSDDVAITAGSAVVVVTAGAKQKPGQSRLDLAGANVRVAQQLTPELLRHSPNAVILYVTNPVDVVTMAALEAGNGDRSRIFGSGTLLDTSRLRYLIGRRVNLTVANVHAYIVGEHGDSEIPLWSSAIIGGTPLHDYRTATGVVFGEPERRAIADEVVGAAYEIIKGKGATNLAIGLSTVRIIEAVLRDERVVLPVSTLQTGAVGVSGVCLSLPTVVSARGAERVLDVPMSDDERAALHDSAETLRRTQRELGL